MERKTVLADAAGFPSNAGDGAAGNVLAPFDEHAAINMSVTKRTWRIDLALRPF
jgi:hypothetical protein